MNCDADGRGKNLDLAFGHNPGCSGNSYRNNRNTGVDSHHECALLERKQSSVARARSFRVNHIGFAASYVLGRHFSAFNGSRAVTSIDGNHSHKAYPVTEDRILEDLFLSKVSDVAEVSYPKRNLDEALVVWGEDVSLFGIQPLESGYFHSDSHHRETRFDEKPHRRIEYVLVFSDQDDCY